MVLSYLVVIIVILQCAQLPTTASNEANHIHPIIIIPGFLGSQMRAILDKPSRVSWFCNKQKGWHNIWYDSNAVTPIAVNCWVDNMRLVFNPESGTTRNSPGVETRMVAWGHTYGVEDLSSWSEHKNTIGQQSEGLEKNGYLLGKTAYFSTFVNYMVEELHYIRNKSIRAAPYDFRKAPFDDVGYFFKLTKLIEDTYVLNGNKSIILLSHSMGCMQTLYLLKGKSQDWKDTYIKAWIPIAAPFGGSLKTLRALNEGEPLLFNWFKEKMRNLFRTFSSSYFLLPDARVFKDQGLWRLSNDVTLSAKDMEKILLDMDLHHGVKMWNQSKELIPDYGHPDVNVYCIFVGNDDYVSSKSQNVCKRWILDNAEDRYFQWNKFNHVNVIRDETSVRDIARLIRLINKKKKKPKPKKEDPLSGSGSSVPSISMNPLLLWITLATALLSLLLNTTYY